MADEVRYVCQVVARRRGCALATVADEPYAAVLYEWDAGNEDEEICGIQRMAEAIQLARMIGVAFHDGKKLVRFDAALAKRAARLNQVDRDEALARAAQMADDVARAERIARRKRRD